MTGFEKYIKDIQSGKIVSCLYIKQAVQRFVDMSKRPDIYVDKEEIQKCVDFIKQIKHFKGLTVGQPFVLSDWQEFIVANIIGLKWKKTGLRVCRETYIQVARKAGKDMLISALCLYMLIVDGEASPEIACLANSREQANILFDFITKNAKSIDPKGNVLSYYRNYVKCPLNNGIVKAYSAANSKLDGLSISFGVIDEFHEAKDRKLYDVIKSSQAGRRAPIMAVITTAGFNLESPCHDMYNLGIEILAGIKQDDTFFPFIYTYDKDDKWDDPNNFIKSQPNLGVSVDVEYVKSQILKAKNDSTALNDVKTKTLDLWVSSSMEWIPQELIAQNMKKVSLEDYPDKMCYVGVDLASVDDFSSLSVMIPLEEDKFVFKTWTFIPYDTYIENPNKALYDKFINEGSMIITPGNVTDYNYIIQYINEISQYCQIQGIYYDKYNATSWAIKCTELGYNMVEFSQAISNFNKPTKEFERLLRSGQCIIDKSSNILWQFGNVVLREDANQNVKPDKASNKNKIDSIISQVTALGGYLINPTTNDFEIFVL